MKKKLSIVALSALVFCIFSCTDNSHIEEMVEEYMEKPETECPHSCVPDRYGYNYEKEDTLPVFDKE